MDLMEDFYTEFGEHNYGVISMHKGAAEGLVYFQGATRRNYWKTTGDGTFTEYQNGDNYVFNLSPHKTDPNLLLRETSNCHPNVTCTTELQISRDQGVKWQSIRSYVYGFSWGIGYGEIVFISLPEDMMHGDYMDAKKQDMRLYTSSDLGASVQFASEPGVYEFSYENGVAYVVKIEKSEQSELYLSNDLNSLVRAQYRGVSSVGDIETTIYEVLESNQDVAFMAICNGGRYPTLASLFQANVNDGMFWVTRPTLRATCDPYNWHGVDFQKIHSLPGTFFSNGFSDSAFASASNDIEDYIQSAISFNKGGTWEPLPGPQETCSVNDNCYLHLFSGADRNTPPDVQHIYSSEDAVGLIVATGNEGQYRQPLEQSNTYFTRSGGYSWYPIAAGRNVISTAAHGSIMLMVPINDTGTNFLNYSWNQGISWGTCAFADDKVTVEKIIDISVYGKSPELRFLIIGIGSLSAGGFVTTVTFKDATPRECHGYSSANSPSSDFETFTAATVNSCLNGEYITYTRRKREAVCVNLNDEVPTVTSSCYCTRQDYTCDGDCWAEDLNKAGEVVCVNICAGLPNDPMSPPDYCPKGQTYLQPSGYRLVEGDKCVGGVALDTPIEVSCP
eukprot:CAMPEP_0206193024 /NCGR_PEP_ID=MMETSP0166-20121206/6318_1 /ASSEMBLY_ACC=CAM_ASM_000260 /TAXON_ID=95228 /ORGANISM="Vannella robusta, Strain DIVA3 518/3/11/1/6" /LENGTH=616 /DNA_ID=CAMNT_0053609653 /DNA_START=729 /DNA_END=2579 /DNA_ORIENTATION=-